MVAVAFLPICNTNTDIDQTFSTTSKRLEKHEAITRDGLHSVLSDCYNKHTVVSSLKNEANWSQLCESSGLLTMVDRITQYKLIRFSNVRSKEAVPHSSECTVEHCVVRVTVNESWVGLPTNQRSSFLTGLPNLSDNPPEQLTAPDDVEDVTARLESEASRIPSSTKMSSLVKYAMKYIGRVWSSSTGI